MLLAVELSTKSYVGFGGYRPSVYEFPCGNCFNVVKEVHKVRYLKGFIHPLIPTPMYVALDLPQNKDQEGNLNILQYLDQ
jgi:hypothetical protein